MACVWTSSILLAFVLLRASEAHLKNHHRHKIENHKTEIFDDVNIDDVIFADGLLFESAVRSKVDCIRRCSNRHDCTSVTFIRGPSGKACRAHSTWVTSYSVFASSSTGAKTYRRRDKPVVSTWVDKKCQSRKHCKLKKARCYGGRCVCEPGLYYSISQDTCVSDCEEHDLRSHFQRYEDRYINLNNIEEFSDLTINQCFERCLTNPSCVTIDYVIKDERCKLSRVTAADVSLSLWETLEDVDHYQRVCV